MMPVIDRHIPHKTHGLFVNRTVFFRAVFLLLGCALGCHQAEDSELDTHDPIRPVLSIVAAEHRGPSSGYSGRVEARFSTKLGFRLLGSIVTRQVHLGDTVGKGQLLGTIDNADLAVALTSAEASLSIAKAESDNASANFIRQETLLDRKATAQADFDIAERSMQAASSAVIEAQSVVDRARENLAYTSLNSDMDGVVTGVYAEVGETVAAGQVVFSIADPSQREVVIDMGDDMLASIHVGSEFRVVAPPTNYECIGRVREIAPQADIKTQTSRIKISLEDASEAFRLGATIKAFPQFSLAEKISLPVTAILDRDGNTYAWIVDRQNNKVNLVQVTLSDRSETNVIVSSGISVGDQVVIAGVHSLTDGQSVLVQAGAAR